MPPTTSDRLTFIRSPKTKRNIALFVAGLSTGLALAYLRHQGINSVIGFISYCVVGYFIAGLVVIIAVGLSMYVLGNEGMDLDQMITIISIVLVVICIGLLFVEYGGPFGDDYEEGFLW